MSGHHHAPTRGRPDLAARLHERGLRMTPQRQRVLAAVRAMGHATPEQIADRVPDVDLATVYRALELLEDLDMVRHTHLDHGAPAYRPAEDDHVHVVCHDCGSVVEAPDGLADELERRLREERGFRLDRAHLTVFGRCEACAASLGEPPDEPSAEQSRGPRR